MKIWKYFTANFAFFAVVLMACSQPTTPDNPTSTITNQNQTPAAADYDIGNLTQTEGNVTPVSIMPKQGKSGGDITIFYRGAGSTTYPKSTTPPTAAGTYIVTFDVEAATGFIAASGLSAGTLTITAANQNQTQNQTPAAADYDFGNLTQIAGNITAVTITPKSGKSTGAITIYYNGSTTLPAAVGTYTVTFDVAAVNGWNAASGLSAGTLTINAKNASTLTIDPIAAQTYTGNALTPTVTVKNGSTTLTLVTDYTVAYNSNTNAGTATVTVSGAGNYTGTTTTTFTISNATPVVADYNFGNMTQIAGNVTAVIITPKTGKSSGAVTIYYDNSTTLPKTAGTYAVSFDVAAVTNWNAASSLSAGNLIIGRPDNQNPAVTDYDISGTGTVTYDGKVKIVSVTAKKGKSSGTVSIKYNNSATAPSVVGTYAVTFDVEAADGWNGASGLSAGTLNINKATGATVSAPTLNTGTYNSITINAVSTPTNGQTVEYARNTLNSAPSTGWQDSTTFTGLNANTTYYIFARSKENHNYNAGTASGSTAITTLVQMSPNDTFTINFEHIDDDSTALPWNIGGSPVGNKLTLLVGQSITLTLGNFSQYSGVEWIVDGMVKGGGAVFTLKDFTKFDIGTHTLTVEVWIGGVPYSRTIPLEVIGN